MNELECFLTVHTKVNSKQIKVPNIRPETIKLQAENIGRTLFDINRSYLILDLSPMAKETKAKINKWDPVKLKNFCTVKETINKMKRQPTEWENINCK